MNYFKTGLHRDLVKRFYALIFILLFPTVSLAQSTCAQLYETFRLSEPESLPPDGLPLEIHTVSDCTPEQTMMFIKNTNTLNNARPVDDLAKLNGSYIGDNIYANLIGVMVFGQEMIKISHEPDTDEVNLEQYWMVTTSQDPNIANNLWSEDGEYQLMISKITYQKSSNENIYYPIGVDHGIFSDDELAALDDDYPLPEGSFSNYLMDRRNQSVTFRLDDQNGLVLGQLQNVDGNQIAISLNTYTKVEDNAAETALALIYQVRLAGMQFDCLAHELSETDSALTTKLAPITRSELYATLQSDIGRIFRHENLRELRRKMIAEGRPVDVGLKEEFSRSIDDIEAAESNPTMLKLKAMQIGQTGSEICEFL